MLQQLEKLATFLHRFRIPYFGLGVVGFVALGVLDFSGIDTMPIFILCFLWYFGIANFVGTMRNLDKEAERYEGMVPSFVSGIILISKF